MYIKKIRDLAIAIAVLFASFSYGYTLLSEAKLDHQYNKDKKDCLLENNNWGKYYDDGYSKCMRFRGYITDKW